MPKTSPQTHRTRLPKSQKARIEKFRKWLRNEIPDLIQQGAAPRASVAEVEAYGQIYLHVLGGTHAINIEYTDWCAWGKNLMKQWWELSTFPTVLVMESDEIQSSLLRHSNYKIYSDSQVSVFHKAGSPLLHFGDDIGLECSEVISPLAGGESFVANPQGPYDRAWVRHQLEDKRSLHMEPQGYSISSMNRSSKILLEETKRGVHSDLINSFSDALRQALPRLKAGAPLISDVRAKLDMEAKLRKEEDVTGSLRPLALTLEALQGTNENDVHYPGLWMFWSDTNADEDIRPLFKHLLLWDSALHVVAAAVRFHGEYKSGLTLGKEPSHSTYVVERRFSKRDSGEVESVYVQINPTRIAGNTDAVTTRLLTYATHELAHVSTYSNIRHPETFIARRDQFLNSAADHIADIRSLVELSGLTHDRFRPSADRPFSLEQFLLDELRSRPSSLVSFLSKRWAAFRNISENRATEDVLAEIDLQERLGRVERLSKDVVRLV